MIIKITTLIVQDENGTESYSFGIPKKALAEYIKVAKTYGKNCHIDEAEKLLNENKIEEGFREMYKIADDFYGIDVVKVEINSVEIPNPKVILWVEGGIVTDIYTDTNTDLDIKVIDIDDKLPTKEQYKKWESELTGNPNLKKIN